MEVKMDNTVEDQAFVPFNFSFNFSFNFPFNSISFNL